MARLAGGTYRGSVALLVVFLVSCGALLSVALTPAAADVTTVTGGAFNYSTDVGPFGGEPQRRGHGQPADAPAAAASPSVECPEGGGRSSVTDPDGASAAYGPATLFGGLRPEGAQVAPPSGPLTSSIDCKPGEDGHVIASTSLTLMPEEATWVTPGGRAESHPGGIGPGPFVAEEVHSSCTATAAGVTSDVTIVGGFLQTSYHPDTQEPVEVQGIPESPPSNYTREGTIDHVGDRYRIVFNERIVNPDGSFTVNAVRIELVGDATVGDVIIGQSRCGMTASSPAPTSTAPPSAAAAAPPNTSSAERPDTSPPQSPTTAGASRRADSPVRSTATAAPRGERGTAPVTVAQAPGELTGLAYNYYVDVGLFGGPSMLRGYGQAEDAPDTAASPSVECPEGGGADSATAPNGAAAVYGPATIFGGIWPEEAPSAPPSGPLTSEIDCQPDEVTASTSVTLPRGVGPGPFIAEEVHSSCTANAAGVTSEVSFVNGILELSYHPDTQLPVETEPIPDNPPPNYTREGTIDHVGDNFRITLNEQIENPDGSLTVNAAHMELLGPIAVGHMVVGSVTCGGTGAAAPGTGTPGTGTPGTGTPGTGTPDTTETGTPGAGGTGSGGQVARTGTDPRPAAALGVGLLLLGTLALQGERVRARAPGRRAVAGAP